MSTFRSQQHPPLCRLCAKPIAKRTTVHFISASVSRHSSEFWKEHKLAALPADKAALMRLGLTNERIVSIAYNAPPGNEERAISRFSTWDGESYVDAFFCTGACAQRFAYVMARHGSATVAWSNAMIAAGRDLEANTATRLRVVR